MKNLVKQFLCLILAITLLPFAATTKDIKSSFANELTLVHHLFTHSLIAHESVAFAEGNTLKKHLLADCITAPMFETALELLFKNDFVLVSPKDVYFEKEGKIYRKNPLVPKGKKPLILSFDDINYYRSKKSKGFSDKLIVQNGRLATYTETAKNKISFDNEVVTVLENFVEKHPDFSFNNAKGILFLTGYDGVLGYRTDRNSPNRESEISAVRPVVAKLKENGWVFGCHSYGHGHMKSQSEDKFFSDVDKWQNEVAPLVGKTNLFAYPYGEWEISTVSLNNDKHEYLQKNGFNFFFGVGSQPFFVPKNSNRFLFMDRAPLDGQSLTKRPHSFSRFFGEHKITFN